MPLACFQVTVSGRVQGVGYRDWTKRQAKALSVAGWVRNLPNGDVEALLQGEEFATRELVERMRRGPPLASVTRLEAIQVPADTSIIEFMVRC